MRHVGFIALALVAVACGPDPNARLPGSAAGVSNGGTNSGAGGEGSGGVGAGGSTPSNGGSSGSGGSKVDPGSGGAAGSSPFDTGGSGSGGVKVGSGGAAGSSPFETGGAAGKGSGGKGGGGVTGSGGATSAGGATSKGGSGGGSTSSTWGVGPEPCSPAKDLSCASGNGNTGNFEGTTFCFRTADKIAGWSCNSMDGWTMTINGKVTPCTSGMVSSSTLPPAIDGIYYFQFTGDATSKTWASLSWYANTGDCKAGPYPAWGSSGSSSADAGG